MGCSSSNQAENVSNPTKVKPKTVQPNTVPVVNDSNVVNEVVVEQTISEVKNKPVENNQKAQTIDNREKEKNTQEQIESNNQVLQKISESNSDANDDKHISKALVLNGNEKTETDGHHQKEEQPKNTQEQIESNNQVLKKIPESNSDANDDKHISKALVHNEKTETDGHHQKEEQPVSKNFETYPED